MRDVVQNHLFQVMANVAMEPPPRTDSESIRDEKVKVLKAIPPLEAKNLVRGQFRGYRNEKGVAPDSKVETFAALELEIDSWRWKGVPFYIRAGKCLPVTCAEIVVRFRQPPTMYSEFNLQANYFRFRISPRSPRLWNEHHRPGRGYGHPNGRDGGQSASSRGRDGCL